MPPIAGKILTRETLVEVDGNTKRSIPADEFEVLINTDETLGDIDPDVLANRLRMNFEPYTDDGDENHPRIIIIPFDLEITSTEDVTITAPFIGEQDVISVKNVLAEGTTATEEVSQYAASFSGLSEKLIGATCKLANTPDANMWYEATPSQFLFIPPGSHAMIGDREAIGAPMGTFILSDLDPRFVRVDHDGPGLDDFSEKLETELLVLSAETDNLFGRTDCSTKPKEDVKDTLLLTKFQDNSPFGHVLLSGLVERTAA